MNHVPGDLVGRYAQGDQDIPADQVWAVEAHLETCAECRQRLAEHAQGVSALLDTVWAGLELTGKPAKHRRFTWWAAPAVWPWLGMTVVVMMMALVIDLFATAAGSPSLVLLLAPIAPVLGVAAVWTNGMDPAHELVTATARAGLSLVLRRTVAVLVVVIPVLLLAGWPVSASPALWLLPCLAFTVGTLAVGGAIGMNRAAIVLGAGWATLVVGPSLVMGQAPVVLQTVSLPVWALVIVLCGAVLALRADSYARLG
jgi:hypothetical protein